MAAIFEFNIEIDAIKTEVQNTKLAKKTQLCELKEAINEQSAAAPPDRK